jgi:uncharacterized repeat protein (TIGR01451 family)
MRGVEGLLSGDSSRHFSRGRIRHNRAIALALGLAFVLLGAVGLAPSAQAASIPLVQFFYVPFPEDQVLAMLKAVQVGGGGSVPIEPVTSYVTITAVANGTRIIYDQWENGYDVDLSDTQDTYSAANLDGTQIWGDGNAANGAPPGIPTDVINAGTVIKLESRVVSTTRQAVIDFDGGDKFAADKTIAVTRTSWADASGTLFAGCVEVFDTNNWGMDYRSPVGVNTDLYTPTPLPDYDIFEYTALSIMAGEGGATINVDTNADGDYSDAGVDLLNYSLAEGASTYVTNAYVGAHITSTAPVQVDIFTGDIGSQYESRDSALIPTDMWTDYYYTPTSTANVSYNTGDERTIVWLYNSGATGITVTYKRRSTAGVMATNTVSVPAGRVAQQILENGLDGTGASFYTSNGAPFYAYSTTDSASADTTRNQAWDWSFTLIPDSMLTTQALIGLGIGQDPGQPLTENGNPIWVTTLGNANSGETPANVYVDYDSNPATGRFTDAAQPSGYRYDARYTLRELEQARVYVPSQTAGVVAVVASSTAAAPTTALATTLSFVHATTFPTSEALAHAANQKNRLLLVGVSIANSNLVAFPQRTVLSVTYGGVPLEYVTGSAQQYVSGNAQPRVELWGLANPPRGSANVVVTLTGAGVVMAGATTFSGVDVADGWRSALGTGYGAVGNSLTAQVNVTGTSVGQVVYDVVATATYRSGSARSLNVGGGQVSQWSQNADSAVSGTRLSVRGGGSTKTVSGATTNMSWTIGSSSPWAIYAVPVKPAPAGAKTDQTGLLLYTLDTSVKLAVAWGQDPWTASASVPGLDVGTSVPPMPEFQTAKDGVLYADNDSDGYISPGDVIEYPITVFNTSRLPVPNVIIWDEIPTDTTYVPGSTKLDGVTIPDDVSGTAFPLDGAGYPVGTLAVGGQKIVTFRVTIDAYESLTPGILAIVNGGEGRALGHNDPVDDDAYLRGRISDYVWFDTDADGVQDAAEHPIPGVVVQLLNAAGAPVYDTGGNPVTDTTDQNGKYEFLGLPAAQYIVKFIPPAGMEFTLRDVGQVTVDIPTDSDANPTAGADLGKTALIPLGGGQTRIDADAGLVLTKPTLAVVSSFDAYVLDGKVVVNWVTGSETNTAGFDVQRLDAFTREWVTVNAGLVPALFESPNGGSYTVVDESARTDRPTTYRLLELETTGATVIHGPYQVNPRSALSKGQAYTELSDGAEMARVSRSVSPSALSLTVASGSWTKTPSVNADRLRIQVTDPGLYKVTSADLVKGLRLTEARARGLIRAMGLELTSQGKAVAYLPAADGSALYFYGQSIDSVYTTDNVYWLRVGKGTAMKVAVTEPSATTTSATVIVSPATTTTSEAVVVPTSSSTEATSTTEAGGSDPAGDLAPATADTAPTETTLLTTTTTTPPEPEPATTSFGEKLHFEKDLLDVPTLFHDPGVDMWAWDYLVAGNARLSSKTFSVTAPDVVAGDSLIVRLQGLVTTEKSSEHHVQVSLNGSVLGETWWTGAVPHTATFAIPAGVLQSGDNQVQIVALLDGGIKYSLVALDSLDIAYERALTVVGDQLLFNLSAAGPARVGALSSADAWILDLAEPKTPRVLSATNRGEEAGKAWVEFGGGASDYLVATAAGALRPTNIAAVTAPGLRTARMGADYVVITSPNLAAAAGRLASYRARDGLKTAVVTTTEIYDEFNYGEPSPLSIKSFIEYAATKWKPATRFVVLAGEGSYDYKNNKGNGDSLVPCLLIDSANGLVASDVTLADYVGGDGVPDVAIGRIPAISEPELDAVIAKIKAYEAVPITKQLTALLAADNPDDAGDFAADSDVISLSISKTVKVSKAYLNAANLATVRSAVLSSFSNGTLLVTFVGHASVGQLAAESILSTSDVPALGTNSRLPILTAFTCVAGQYGLPGYDSISEALAMRPKAGAIAVWAPTALEENSESVTLGALFMKNLFGKSRTVRLGSVVQATLRAGAARKVPAEMLRTYNLLGDPALKVRW